MKIDRSQVSRFLNYNLVEDLNGDKEDCIRCLQMEMAIISPTIRVKQGLGTKE